MSDDPDYESDDINEERESVNSTVTYGRTSAINSVHVTRDTGGRFGESKKAESRQSQVSLADSLRKFGGAEKSVGEEAGLFLTNIKERLTKSFFSENINK